MNFNKTVCGGSVKVVDRGTGGFDIEIDVSGIKFTAAIDVFGEVESRAQVLVYSDEGNHDDPKLMVRPFADGTIEVCIDEDFTKLTKTDDRDAGPWLKERDGV